MTIEIINGDSKFKLKYIPDGSFNTCVTSPPYFGLRDYGCEDQVGLEDTPEMYTENLVSIFREVKRVLKEDGTLWLNLGDSWAAQRGGSHMPAQTVAGGRHGKGDEKAYRGMGGKGRSPAHRDARSIGLKHKDLIGIPWRVAFALQEDGWYLRQDIIWHKTNPMPESVRDRCTKSHEYIFLLSKSPNYYYDSEGVKEPVSKGEGKRNRRSVWTIPTKPFKGAHFAVFPEELVRPCIIAGSPKGGKVLDPFMGSGTTGSVAIEEGREFTGIELNKEYVNIAKDRLASKLRSVLSK